MSTTISTPQLKQLVHKPAAKARSMEVFTSHPWARHLKGKVAPRVSSYYNSNLGESLFEKIELSGYSGLVDGLFPELSEEAPRPGRPVCILNAVGPKAIESFRERNSCANLLELREQNQPLPTMPLVELATADELTTYVQGLVLDDEIAPVLYRVKTFFGTGAKLESVHAEVPLPDRIDLHNIQLDMYGINIKTGKRGINITKMIIGDLIWVYSLAVTVKFATSDMCLPETVEDAVRPREPNVWRVARFALIQRNLEPTLGFVVSIVSKQNAIFKLYMKGHRQLVTVNRNRMENPDDFSKLKADSFIVAPFRERQLDYMVFACDCHKGYDELTAFMADIAYYPSPPPTPFNIRTTTVEHTELVSSKLHNFNIREIGKRSSVITDRADYAVHSTIWTSPDLNSFPVIAKFNIPIRKKTGWAVGLPIQGKYQADFLQGQVTNVEMSDRFLHITAKLETLDGVRSRMYLLNSRNRRIAVGTSLHTITDRANPVLTMLESSSLFKLLRSDSLGWKSARALLAGDVQLSGTDFPDQDSITVNVAGTQVRLNEDQTHAINLFNKEYPILVVDSAYGAGKSLCTAVMAKEAVQKPQKILTAAVQNSALDVIGHKITQLQCDEIRPIRYVNEFIARDPQANPPFALQTLLENFHITHRHLLSDKLYKRFERFSDSSRQMREFLFTGTQRHVVTSEHKRLLFLEERSSSEVKILINYFLKLYKPNVYLCTISSALNLTMKKGTWRRTGNSWNAILLDEASMVPEAALMTLMSRFQHARVTLIGDSKQLPPYIGIQNLTLAVAVSSRSVLDVVRDNGSVASCNVRIVYIPHAEMMQLNSELFYENTLTCGTSTDSRPLLLSRVTMPNPTVPIAFVDVQSQSVQSVTGSHSNRVEANAAHVLVRLLLAKGISPSAILVICLYRDQKFLCENILQGTNLTVGTVDSAQGSEQSIVIVCTTRTHFEQSSAHTFFSDPKRLNVALSRAKDGMLIIESVMFLQDTPTWSQIIQWGKEKNVTTALPFFDHSIRRAIAP
ncbi:hypothetical protein OESDEN_02067 [Oesophagostomum dentatum]|uniref:DNA2/NAM7 helicase-like C-terminal domain-containing protein n=1 Tax=Oesophagostomum dentatum TaxID=61180 RepID=A0A0B1TL11_OESDE|nr:hypothetical protein OESDEN_02067 [Oesophagostomum dentatum]